MKTKARFINTGFIIDGIQQPRGFECIDKGQVPYLKIGKWVIAWKSIYEFKLNEEHPLTWIDTDGTHYRPDRHFITDRMSNPKFSQCIWQESRFLGPLFHDSEYCHGGLWYAVPVVDADGMIKFMPEYKFLKTTRFMADCRLARMIRHDPYPGNYLSMAAIWAGVRLGGYFAWNKGDERRPKPKGKIDTSGLPIAFA